MDESLSAEQKTVIQDFERAFSDKRNEQIVLYGVGINTKAILKEARGFIWKGLMDAANEGQTKYGLPVYSAQDIIHMETKPMIVIIARQSVVGIIYKRIAWLQNEYGIKIYDLKGRILDTEVFKYSNENLLYWDSNEQQLERLIDEHEIITFDIFDTLLMRRVLNPTDIFDLVERKLHQKGISIPFKRLRLNAEERLDAQGFYPTIDEIYEELGAMIDLEQYRISSPEELDNIKRMEMESDKQSLLVRQKMIEIFRYALQAGKKIYLLSDMYYTAAYLKEILSSHGICGYDELWVSCDRKCKKADGGMYRSFIQHIRSQKDLKGSTSEILHIGDNRYADYEKAIEAGCDAFLLYSAYELLQASSLQGILASVETLEKRAILGIWMAQAGNNPFAFGQSKGRLVIQNAWEVGYYFMGPIILEFTKSFVQDRDKKVSDFLQSEETFWSTLERAALVDLIDATAVVQNDVCIQQGVLQYVENYVSMYPELGIDVLFADEIYKLLFSDACIIPKMVGKLIKNNEYDD